MIDLEAIHHEMMVETPCVSCGSCRHENGKLTVGQIMGRDGDVSLLRFAVLCAACAPDFQKFTERVSVHPEHVREFK